MACPTEEFGYTGCAGLGLVHKNGEFGFGEVNARAVPSPGDDHWLVVNDDGLIFFGTTGKAHASFVLSFIPGLSVQYANKHNRLLSGGHVAPVGQLEISGQTEEAWRKRSGRRR